MSIVNNEPYYYLRESGSPVPTIGSRGHQSGFNGDFAAAFELILTLFSFFGDYIDDIANAEE